MLRRFSNILFFGVIAIFTVVGCGQKGPLYLPDEPTTAKKQKEKQQLPSKPKPSEQTDASE